MSRTLAGTAAVAVLMGIAMGLILAGSGRRSALGAAATENPSGVRTPTGVSTRLLEDGGAAFDPDWERDYPQYQPLGKVLEPFPAIAPGNIAH